MSDAAKAASRKSAMARRDAAFTSTGAAQAAHLARLLDRYRGTPISGYLPMRTEIDPLPALAAASAHGPVAMPVIVAKGQPLRFRAWYPDVPLIPGPFGTSLPATGDWIIPQVLVLPLLAFSATGGRLGYGGGFYDRTLQQLRAQGPVIAVGFAFAAQRDDTIPLTETDQPLDLIVTEHGIVTPAASFS